MKIAIIGYGAMGKMIEGLARRRGHEISTVIDQESAGAEAETLAGRLGGSQVAIDFSVSDAVKRNAEGCGLAGVPLVEGTTGWADDIDAVRKAIESNNGAFVYGANFSIGVNLFYRVVENAAELFSKFGDYEAFIEERHHSRKVDAPSGTALKLLSIVKSHVERNPSVASTRAGNNPGTHVVGFDGEFDQISLKHTARSREGFAAGAVAAAEWIRGKQGFWEFPEVIEEILKGT